MQALDLVNQTFLRKGDTVIIEEENYGGTISRLRRLGVNMVGIPLEKDGMNLKILEQELNDLQKKEIIPRYIYTIPTIQNPMEQQCQLQSVTNKIIKNIKCYFKMIVTDSFEKERPCDKVI